MYIFIHIYYKFKSQVRYGTVADEGKKDASTSICYMCENKCKRKMLHIQ